MSKIGAAAAAAAVLCSLCAEREPLPGSPLTVRPSRTESSSAT
jgi:hypothetical protein